MPGPLPKELRRRVVSAVEGGMSWRGAAEVFDVGPATVIRWMRKKRGTGDVAPEPMGGQRHGLNAEDLDVVAAHLKDKPDATLEELVEAFEARTQKKTSRAAMGRACDKLGQSRKKKSVSATERETPRVQKLREAFVARQKALDPKRLFFLDETGTNVAMSRLYARAPRGERTKECQPRNRGTTLTLIAALTVGGLLAPMTVEGATDSLVFIAYVREILLPELQPGDVVVLDNVGAHKVPEVQRLIEEAGARLLFLPPYSPDLNPIEEAWSKVKSFLRTAKARTVDALHSAIAMALECVTPSDAKGWFEHAGYAYSS